MRKTFIEEQVKKEISFTNNYNNSSLDAFKVLRKEMVRIDVDVVDRKQIMLLNS